MFSGWGKVCFWIAIALLGVTAVCLLLPSRTTNCYQGPKPSRSSARIISISPSATEILYAIGAGNLLIAVDRFSNYPAEAQLVPRIGGLNDPDLEKITALRPSLIILRGRQELIESLCKDQGIEVYFDPTRTLEDIYRSVLELGRLTGHDRQAQALHDSMRAELQQVTDSVAGKPKVRVLLVVSRDSDQLTNIVTVGRTSYLTTLIECAGGISIFGDQEVDYPMVRLESILDARPDVIVDAMPGELDDPQRKQVLAEAWSGLSSVPAVKDKRVFVVTDPYITIPSHRVARLAKDFAAWFHPQPGS